jgi:hypothetical protein
MYFTDAVLKQRYKSVKTLLRFVLIRHHPPHRDYTQDYDDLPLLFQLIRKITNYLTSV